MNSSISLSSDDSDDLPSTSHKRKKVKKDYVISLTSDEDDEHVLKIKKRKKKEKMLGQIDLITSDEEDLLPLREKVDEQVDLLTSEEDEAPKSKRRILKKRKASDEPKSLPKKPKLNGKVCRPKNTGNVNTKLEIGPSWQPHDLLSEDKSIDPEIAKNVINLFKDGNTIPFIARYRRNVTGNMSPETLRDVKETYDEICHLKDKIVTVYKNISKIGKIEKSLQTSIMSARTLEELELIYAPFKPGAKRSLAARAKELGLEEPAVLLLNNTVQLNLNDYVNPQKKELKTISLVEKGIMHIIASIISTDREMLQFLRELRSRVNFMVETKKSNAKSDTKQNVEGSVKYKNASNENKFERYYNYKIPLKYIKPHQVLAINRGEAQKVLAVKITIPDFVSHEFKSFCFKKWIAKSPDDVKRRQIFDQAIQDCYNRLVQPLLVRETRAELKLKAEKASCEVFSQNLKHLLLSPPLKGKAILGIDPGYTNGCKLALISPTCTLVAQDVIYPHKFTKCKGEDVLKRMLQKHNCSLIALGNGTACRETEEWISQLIKERYFDPLDVKYTIVSEDGASIYSCSPEAKREFPDLDPNIISAVSLARRVQEPMAEFVKVEPKHLGVGMYQHDIRKKQLDEALENVVSECVSFVGVDLNTASQCLLRRIAGLSDKRATQIIDHRTRNGPFVNRKQLLQVFGIGQRIYEQCAGFLRVGPTVPEEALTFYYQPKTNKLDATIIHPESYSLTKMIISKFKLDPKNIGEPSFIEVITSKKSVLDINDLCNQFKSNKETIHLILDALSKPLNHDLRTECSKEPLFKKGLTSMNDLTEGTVLTGRVSNVVDFGCFCDIGVGSNGLIHVSKLNRLTLHIGDRVEVKVCKIDTRKKHIQLEAIKKL